MIDWQDLRFFVSLARHGTLSAAARDLSVDHATVGRRVATLEASLGLRLIDRLPRSCPLTKDGEAIAELAYQIEMSVQAVQRRARGALSLLSGTVRVSAPPALAAQCIAPYVAELRQAHPGLKIVLQAAPSFAALDRGEADIAVRLSRPKASGAIARRIGILRFALYAAVDYVGRPRSEWELVAFDEPLDHVPQQRWLRRVLAESPVAFQASDLFSQIAAVKSGSGVAVLPTIMGDIEPALVRLEMSPEPPNRDIWSATYPDLERSPAVNAVMVFIGECIDRHPGLSC